MKVRSSRRVHSPRGFTLVEILVSIAIIAILLSVFLPAVQFARGGARNTFCQNNLRQQGLAVWQFDDKQAFMPPLWVNMYDQDGRPIVGDRRPSELRSLGGRTKLLPYLEQQSLFGALNLARSSGDPANAEATSTTVGVFQCPATPGYSRRFEFLGQRFGAADYQMPEFINDLPCVWATDTGDPAEVSRRWQGAGTSCPRYADIGDGYSNTVQFFEQAGQPDLYAADGAVIVFGIPLGGWAMASGRTLRTIDPNGAINRENGLGVFSFHPGGANVSMSDGSVHFLAESMDPSVLETLFTRDRLDNLHSR